MEWAAIVEIGAGFAIVIYRFTINPVLTFLLLVTGDLTLPGIARAGVI